MQLLDENLIKEPLNNHSNVLAVFLQRSAKEFLFGGTLVGKKLSLQPILVRSSDTSKNVHMSWMMVHSDTAAEFDLCQVPPQHSLFIGRSVNRSMKDGHMLLSLFVLWNNQISWKYVLPKIGGLKYRLCALIHVLPTSLLTLRRQQ